MWYFGVLLSAVGSICSNLGVNIQKYSFMQNAKLDKDKQKPYTRQPLWALGLGLVIFGSLGDFAALSLAAQSIIAPIGSITLVTNILFAHFGLKEKLTKRDIFGTAMIILGSTTSVAFGNHSEQEYTLEDLKGYYERTLFICYACIVAFFCAILYVLIKKAEPTKIRLVDAESAYEVAVEEADEEKMDALDKEIAVLEEKYSKFEKIHPFCYCALSGTLGAQSILFGKMMASMLAETIRGNNQMKYGLTWVFLGAMLFFIFSQIHFLALGLRFFDSLYVVPVFQCFFITMSTIGGACYFLEFNTFGTLQWILFPIGIFMTLIGVYILSSRGMKQEHTSVQTTNEGETNASNEDGTTSGSITELASSETDNQTVKIVVTDSEADGTSIEPDELGHTANFATSPAIPIPSPVAEEPEVLDEDVDDESFAHTSASPPSDDSDIQVTLEEVGTLGVVKKPARHTGRMVRAGSSAPAGPVLVPKDRSSTLVTPSTSAPKSPIVLSPPANGNHNRTVSAGTSLSPAQTTSRVRPASTGVSTSLTVPTQAWARHRPSSKFGKKLLDDLSQFRGLDLVDTNRSVSNSLVADVIPEDENKTRTGDDPVNAADTETEVNPSTQATSQARQIRTVSAAVRLTGPYSLSTTARSATTSYVPTGSVPTVGSGYNTSTLSPTSTSVVTSRRASKRPHGIKRGSIMEAQLALMGGL